MANPHLHLQQKGALLLQQLQLLSLALSRFCLYEDLVFESVMFRYPVPANCRILFNPITKIFPAKPVLPGNGNKWLQNNCQDIMYYLKCLCRLTKPEGLRTMEAINCSSTPKQ
jgi:hypothetical protein